MKPLILDFAVAREELDEGPEFQYSREQSVNVISLNGKTIPIIEVNIDILNAVTQTRVSRESSDRDRYLGTETKTAREGTDRSLHIAELKKKTFAARETDNERFNYQ